MVDYWSNYCCRQGMSLLNILVRDEPLNSELQNLAQEIRSIPLLQEDMNCILNRIGVTYECDRQTDGRTLI